VSDSVDLPADDVQTLLSKLHTVVRLFVKSTNAFYKGEESASDQTTTTAFSSEPSPPAKKSPTPPMLLNQAPLLSVVYRLSSANIRQLTVN